MFDVDRVIVIGSSKAISTSKIRKITAIKKNHNENFRFSNIKNFYDNFYSKLGLIKELKNQVYLFAIHYP
jgi:hypothetical protein